MSAATLTAKGQIVIPAEIRARYGLTPGTQLEFGDEGGVIRLVVRRRVTASEPAAGYGLIRVEPLPAGQPQRRLAQFDPASLLRGSSSPKTSRASVAVGRLGLARAEVLSKRSPSAKRTKAGK